MVEKCQPGKMAAIFAPRDQVEKLLAGNDAVQIAAINALTNTVVSGTDAGMAALLEAAQAAGIEGKELVVSHAFHSLMMTPMLAEFKEIAESIEYQPASIDIISTVSGALNQGEMSSANYWVEHVKRPVLFVDAVQNRCG